MLIRGLVWGILPWIGFCVFVKSWVPRSLLEIAPLCQNQNPKPKRIIIITIIIGKEISPFCCINQLWSQDLTFCQDCFFYDKLELMSKEQGITHLILLIIVVVVLIVVVILVFLGFQASNTLNLKPDQKAQYQNPFNKTSQYQNPFENYQNPFNELKQ